MMFSISEMDRATVKTRIVKEQEECDGVNQYFLEQTWGTYYVLRDKSTTAILMVF